MAALGIRVTVRALPVQELYSRDGPLFRREFEVAQFAWIASADPGGLALWSCTAVPTENNGWTGNNFAGWCFREADQAIRTANTSLDQVERREAYVRQQELFTQEIPVVPLFQRLVVTISNPNMAGLEPDPIAPITWNIGEWKRE
jgi:peptide/nickel transport system substrate-binding protein